MRRYQHARDKLTLTEKSQTQKLEKSENVIGFLSIQDEEAEAVDLNEITSILEKDVIYVTNMLDI